MDKNVYFVLFESIHLKTKLKPLFRMNLLSLEGWGKEEIMWLIDESISIKKKKFQYADALKNKTLLMLFEKPSTRTRVSFEAAMTQLGGHSIYLDIKTTNTSSLEDDMRCISRYADIIMARVFKHETLKIMEKSSKVPVINGLCNKYHPCQILADLMTIKEKFGKFEGLKLAYIGDGNNVCNSLIEGCTKVGIKISVATPKGYEPDKKITESAKKSNLLELTTNPKTAVKGADIIYTDTWISLGQENDKDKKVNDFKGYTVNKELLGNAKFMHCLPAYRGKEVSIDVMDSKNSIVFEQAENRLHIQKAIILKLLGVI